MKFLMVKPGSSGKAQCRASVMVACQLPSPSLLGLAAAVIRVLLHVGDADLVLMVRDRHDAYNVEAIVRTKCLALCLPVVARLVEPPHLLDSGLHQHRERFGVSFAAPMWVGQAEFLERHL